MKNKYYVYEWIRLDTNEPFYVGKGCGNRWRRLTRDDNGHFNNIVRSIPCVVNILHDNLDEQIAYDFECYYIWLYRDIIGYDMCNICDGGEGHGLCGEANGMYGRPWWDENTSQEKIDIWKNNLSKAKKGKNNNMYGKHHTEETKDKMRESLKGKVEGEKNGMYGKQHTEITKSKMSENHADFSYENHPRATKVICITTGKIFNTIKEGAEYYSINRNSIISCCRGKYKSAGKLEDGTKLVWMYYKDYLTKKEETNEI